MLTIKNLYIMSRKQIILFIPSVFFFGSLFAQQIEPQAIHQLIDNYSKARENRDTILLKKILTDDVDQLVSNGQWRYGIRAAVQGMMESSVTNPGTRTLAVERVRFLNKNVAIADARYEIKNPDGTVRKMWSSFTAVLIKTEWKIAAIRNMLPSTGK